MNVYLKSIRLSSWQHTVLVSQVNLRSKIHCRDRKISLQSVADRSKIQYISPITLIPSNSDNSESFPVDKVHRSDENYRSQLAWKKFDQQSSRQHWEWHSVKGRTAVKCARARSIDPLHSCQDCRLLPHGSMRKLWMFSLVKGKKEIRPLLWYERDNQIMSSRCRVRSWWVISSTRYRVVTSSGRSFVLVMILFEENTFFAKVEINSCVHVS